MRVRSLILLVCAVLGTVIVLQGETIVLKNGRRILADTAREEGGKVTYEVGENSYSIPKSLVDHVESGGLPNVARQSNKEDIPDYTPQEKLPLSDSFSVRIVRDGHVDTELLNALDAAGNPQNAAAAYFSAARFEHERGNRDKSLAYLRRALVYLPDNSTLLDHYAATLVQMGRPEEAIAHAEHAARITPDSPETLTVLGFAYFGADRTRDAIRVWKKSVSIRPDATVSKYLEGAERDAAAESDYSQRESGHFTLKYEGKQVSDALSRSILATLENHYDGLVRELGVTPRSNITVVLYTEQAFFDVTQSPAWIGALNDGKIRIPIEGVTSMNGELSRVLRHELAHSFITQVSRGRCPQWLHEGIAQVLEGRNTAPFGRALAKVYARQNQIPLNLLETSFLNLSNTQAALAYSEALAAAEYINSTYGMSDLRNILERIGQGSSTEAALRSTVHSGYKDLEIEIGRYLKDKYGT